MAQRKSLIINGWSGGSSDRLVSCIGQISGLASDRFVTPNGQKR